MKKIIVILFFGLLIAQNNEINSLSEHLKPFERYLGKTFKGEFSNSTKEKLILLFFEIKFNTFKPSSITSGPMPSPLITAILYSDI